MNKENKKDKKFSVGFLVLAILMLLLAGYITIMFNINLPHDTDAVMLLFYILLFSPAVIFILLAFIKKLKKNLFVIIVLIVVSSAAFLYSMNNLFYSVLDKGLSDPNRYSDAIRAIKENDQFPEAPEYLPEKINEKATDVKMSLKLAYEGKPLVFQIEYKLPKDEYNKLKQEWLNKYSDKDKAEAGEGFTGINVYYRENTQPWAESVFYYYNDNECMIRLFVYKGDTSYVF